MWIVPDRSQLIGAGVGAGHDGSLCGECGDDIGNCGSGDVILQSSDGNVEPDSELDGKVANGLLQKRV